MGKQDQGDCRKHLENRREQPIRCSLMDASTNQGHITKDRKRIPDGCLAQHGGILPRRDQFRAVPGPIQSVDSFGPDALHGDLQCIGRFFRPPRQSGGTQPFADDRL